MNNNKNILLAMALCAATFFVWQYFVANPAMKAEQARQAHLTHQEKTKAGGAPVLPGIAAGDVHMTREAALKARAAVADRTFENNARALIAHLARM